MKRSVSSANKRYLRVASRIAERLKTYQISGEHQENHKRENLKASLPSKGNIFSILAKSSWKIEIEPFQQCAVSQEN